MPPLWPDHENFFQATLYKKMRFAVFQQLSEKMGEFAASIERSKTKSVSASGGLRPPDLPTRGSASGPRWGRSPQTPVIGSRSARSPWPPLCQILNMPLVNTLLIFNFKAQSSNRRPRNMTALSRHSFLVFIDTVCGLSLIHIWRCRRIERCRSRWSPYH